MKCNMRLAVRQEISVTIINEKRIMLDTLHT